MNVQKYFSAHHHACQAFLCGVSRFHGSHDLSIAHNGDTIGDLFHFTQFMGNENNGLSFSIKTQNSFEQILGFLRVKTAVGSSKIRISTPKYKILRISIL
jgi:hypothetical protein